MEMLYAGERIENLTATKIAFWNAGNVTISSNDFASKKPFTIKVKECKILRTEPYTVSVKTGYKILDVKKLYYNPINQVEIKCSKDKSQIKINFEYLAKNEGAIIQLLHTGKS
ncbi:MAG: hypothetical protein O8C58_07200, partial [Candidatus Methanoperedens sp.]|nr:hypothetical protein [Candidatus Methanoperedens sp.]